LGRPQSPEQPQEARRVVRRGCDRFQRPEALDWDDPEHSEFEWRSRRLGASLTGRILIVAYTLRRLKDGKEIIRIISARHATRKEPQRAVSSFFSAFCLSLKTPLDLAPLRPARRCGLVVASPLHRLKMNNELPSPTPRQFVWLSKQTGCKLGSSYLLESKWNSKGQKGQSMQRNMEKGKWKNGKWTEKH